MKINQIIRERSQQDDGCPPCPPATPPAKQRDGMINHPMVDKALTPHWLTNLIPGFAPTQQVAKAARDLVNAISTKDPRALAAAVASAPGPLQAAAGITNQALNSYDTVKKDGPGVLSKIQSYNPFRSRSGPPAPIEDRIAKPVTAQPYSQRVGEILGDTVGTVTTVPDASGKIKIKTPTGTEIETNKDALLPGAKPGTVQMKPDAAGDALKPGTQVVSAEATEELSRIKELAGTQATPIPGDDLTPVEVPPIPKMPAQDAVLPAGQRIMTNKDGTISYNNEDGTFIYNPQGKAIKYQPPAIMGLTRVVDLITGQTSTNFKQGPTTINRTHDATGKSLRTGLNYDLGAANTGIDRDDTSGAASTNIYSRDPDLTKKMAAQGINVPYSVKENTSMRNLLQIVKEAELNQPAAPATAAPTTPQVDPAKYQVPSIDFFKKNYKHPADIIDGAHPSTSDPTRIGAWQGGSDFADLMMALSGSYYQARQADPNFKQPAFVKDDWELIQRMLGTPEGKEYAIDQSIGLSNIDDKSPDAEFNRAQHKEFEKQANARFMQQPDGIFTPGWKYDQKLGMTPAQAELQKQKAQQQPAVPVKENTSMRNLLQIVKEAEINQPAANNPALPTADEINKIKASIPQLPAQDGDLGDGVRVQTNPDGTRSYKSEAGTYTYDAQGKAITYTSPKMSGFGKTLDLTTNEITLDYHAGPLSTTAKTDAQGRGTSFGLKYNLGGGQYHSLDKEIDHASGITSTTLTPGGGVDPNELLPTAAIAKAKGVDPAKFAAFQKQNPTAVKEDDNIKARAKVAFDQLDNPKTELKTSSDAEIRARLAAQKEKGTKLKDMNPLDRDQWLKDTGQYWDTVTQTVKPLPVKESADDKLLQQMLSIARLR